MSECRLITVVDPAFPASAPDAAYVSWCATHNRATHECVGLQSKGEVDLETYSDRVASDLRDAYARIEELERALTQIADVKAAVELFDTDADARAEYRLALNRVRQIAREVLTQ